MAWFSLEISVTRWLRQSSAWEKHRNRACSQYRDEWDDKQDERPTLKNVQENTHRRLRVVPYLPSPPLLTLLPYSHTTPFCQTHSHVDIRDLKQRCCENPVRLIRTRNCCTGWCFASGYPHINRAPVRIWNGRKERKYNNGIPLTRKKSKVVGIFMGQLCTLGNRKDSNRLLSYLNIPSSIEFDTFEGSSGDYCGGTRTVQKQGDFAKVVGWPKSTHFSSVFTLKLNN